MSEDAAGRLARRAEELRREFDRSFAEPVRTEAAREADFLAVRIGAEACALRLSEITGLHADRKITRVPGGDAALLGIAGFRGTILPVYSLRALLGRPAADMPRWLVVAAGAPIALGFEGFQGHLRIARDAILPQQSGERRGYAREYVRAHSLVRPIIDLPAVLATIGLRTPEAAPKEER
jgi:chemotaxis signal transduction protein